MASSRRTVKGKPAGRKAPAKPRPRRETRAEKEARLLREASLERRRLRARERRAEERAEAERQERASRARKRLRAARKRQAEEEARRAEEAALAARKRRAAARKRRQEEEEAADVRRKRLAEARRKKSEAKKRAAAAEQRRQEIEEERRERASRGGRLPRRVPVPVGKGGKAVDRANADLVHAWLKDLFSRVGKKTQGSTVSSHLYASDRTVEAAIYLPPPPRGKKLREWLTDVSDAFESNGRLDSTIFYRETFWQVRLRFVGWDIEAEPESPGDNSRMGEDGERYETFHSHWFTGRLASALVTMEEMYPLIRKSLGPEFRLFRVSIHANWNPKGLRPDRASGARKS